MRYKEFVEWGLMPNRDNRSEGRSNVFLAVSLKTGDRIIPVRVRNIASRGMLVEGVALPPIGTRVTLVRGDLSAAGQLAWVVTVTAESTLTSRSTSATGSKEWGIPDSSAWTKSLMPFVRGARARATKDRPS